MNKLILIHNPFISTEIKNKNPRPSGPQIS